MTGGYGCRICGRRRPNEAFSGRGRRDHVCKGCQKLPSSERVRADVKRELRGYAKQPRISGRNILRLMELSRHEDPDIRKHAAALVEIAAVCPGGRRRWVRLASSHPALFGRYREAIGVLDEADARDVFGDEAMEVLRGSEGLVGPDLPGSTDDEPDIPF